MADGTEDAAARCRLYVPLFIEVVTRVEEMLVGERLPDDPATWAAVIARLERASGMRAPRAVRSCGTGADLHAALLDWQDEVEIRDGRGAREPEMEVKRPPDLAELGVRLRQRPVRPGAAARSSRSAA